MSASVLLFSVFANRKFKFCNCSGQNRNLLNGNISSSTSKNFSLALRLPLFILENKLGSRITSPGAIARIFALLWTCTIVYDSQARENAQRSTETIIEKITLYCRREFSKRIYIVTNYNAPFLPSAHFRFIHYYLLCRKCTMYSSQY